MGSRHSDPKPHPGVSQRQVERQTTSGRTVDSDAVAVEEPLELRTRAGAIAVIMRTPGADRDLALGFLWSEGLVRAGEGMPGIETPDRSTLRPQERGNVLVVDLEPELVAERMSARSLAVSSSCGICGAAALAAVDELAEPVRSNFSMPAELVLSLPDRLREAQEVFESTGGLHAAGLFAGDGTMLAAREDVGRHNAVDKLVGWALAEGLLPLGDAVLCVSGRVSYEIVSKAVLAGIPMLVAVSAPSSLAIDLAERFRVTLCGFTRGGRCNIYTHHQRVAA